MQITRLRSRATTRPTLAGLPFELSRRQFLGAAGATAAVATLAGTGTIALSGPAHATQPATQIPMGALPKPIAATVPTVPPDVPPLDAPFDVIHWLLPGPPDAATTFNGLPGFGLDVDPSTLTDFSGFTAYSVIEGSGRGSDGKTYDVELDVRVMDGTYIAEDGSRHHGTFGFF